MHLHSLLSEGILSIEMTGFVGGVQGEGIDGIHGIGVNTPAAAAVAAETAGLVGDRHIPNGGILVIGV